MSFVIFKSKLEGCLGMFSIFREIHCPLKFKYLLMILKIQKSRISTKIFRVEMPCWIHRKKTTFSHKSNGNTKTNKKRQFFELNLLRWNHLNFFSHQPNKTCIIIFFMDFVIKSAKDTICSADVHWFLVSYFLEEPSFNFMFHSTN